MDEINSALNSEEYISEFLIEENYTVYLIDDAEKLQFAMKKLSENDKIAFDVEANYVCQNVEGIQQACLLQIACRDCVLLIDIFVLIEKVSDEVLKCFFEMFLGCDTDRIVFDIRSDLNLLQRTFNWMPEYLQRVQPTFHCVQRFAKLVSTSDKYKDIFDKVPNPSLKDIAAKWLGVDLSKDERQGNWLRRPLTKEQMNYAAKDARYTMDLYYYIQKKLSEQNLQDDMARLVITPKMVDRKKVKGKKGEKETMEEILESVEAKMKEMKEKFYNFERPENITIVIDFEFLPIAPILRQFGYKTFDQRDLENGDQFSRDEVVAALSKFMNDCIDDKTIKHCYLLTEEQQHIRFKTKVGTDDLKIINCGREETESSVICEIMYETNTIFDLSNVEKRCTKCGEEDYAIDFPADVFRVVYFHYAKQKDFFYKLKCNSPEILGKLEREKVVEIRDQIMTYRINNFCAASFNLGDEIMGHLKYQDENGDEIQEKKNYKCNTRLFEKLGDKPFIRLCLDCFEFF
uniref:3'-5' exonuclease domain-containing protein n=1 Tax=Panagrolaimus sp. PS1159 TaxID=55785 RepID=A0AC35G222_9BILA